MQETLGVPRHYLALHLPRWETDCLRRVDPVLAELNKPLVLWEKQRGTMRLVAVDGKASAEGLFRGQSLSDARAIVPGLEAREIDRDYLGNVFAEFADWHSNASPIVSVLTDQAPWGDLIIDIAGVSHLFGGERRMFETLVDRLIPFGFTVTGAVAPSVGAAWALAHYAPGQVIGGDLESALENLPVAALRLEEGQISVLTQMGLKRIGQLYGRDRRSLMARFGASLLLRLDQALGFVEERVTPRLPLAERYVERRFVEPIGLMDDVLMTVRDLAVQLASRLEEEGLGAQTFHLFLYRVDHKVMTFSVNAARATRDPHHVARLFAYRAERFEGEYDAGFGVDMIRLAASSVSPILPAQIGIFDTRNVEDLNQLYDRISSRLGSLAVLRSKFVNTHIPEQAIKLEPVVTRTPDDPQAIPDPHSRRPLRLLPVPELITVSLAEVPDGPPPSMVWRGAFYRFNKTSGPERIGVEWWALPKALIEVPKGDQENTEPNIVVDDGRALTRDYYIAEDNGGHRFWLFREGLYAQGMTHRWYLHGFFA